MLLSGYLKKKKRKNCSWVDRIACLYFAMEKIVKYGR